MFNDTKQNIKNVILFKNFKECMNTKKKSNIYI